MVSKLTAECLGTFWLVLGGCGSAVLAAAFPDVGIGLLGVSLAFGLTVRHRGLRVRPGLGRSLQPRRVARPVGRRPISRPAAAAVHRAQVVGGVAGAGVLYLIASGRPGFQPRRRVRLQRLRRALAGRLFARRRRSCAKS